MLERAIASVRRQRCQDFELLVVDDASDVAVDAVAMDDRRIRVRRNRTSLGVAGARKVGLNAASGACISFLDDDDEFMDCGYFQGQTKAPHAFQVVMNLPYEPADCFKVHRPLVVPARTFLSQLL